MFIISIRMDILTISLRVLHHLNYLFCAVFGGVLTSAGRNMKSNMFVSNVNSLFKFIKLQFKFVTSVAVVVAAASDVVVVVAFRIHLNVCMQKLILVI